MLLFVLPVTIFEGCFIIQSNIQQAKAGGWQSFVIFFGVYSFSFPQIVPTILYFLFLSTCCGKQVSKCFPTIMALIFHKWELYSPVTRTVGECLRGCFLGFCVYIVRWAGWQVFVLQAIVGCCAAHVLVGEKQLSKKSRLLLRWLCLTHHYWISHPIPWWFRAENWLICKYAQSKSKKCVAKYLVWMLTGIYAYVYFII